MWRPPSQMQVDLETTLAKLIKEFLDEAKLSKDVVELPGTDAETKLRTEIETWLRKASHEGERIASGDAPQEERSMVIEDLFSKAAHIVATIVEQLAEKAQELLDMVLGTIEDSNPEEALSEVEAQLEDWAEDYSELVAQTEIHAAVEEAVADTLAKKGVDKIYWNCEPDACQRCQSNAEASPIALGSSWPSGDAVPPGHPRCRCTISS